MESQTCAVGGWGPMFGTKSQKNGFFLGTFPNIANIAPSSNPWSPSNAIKYSKKETEDSLLDTFDNIEEEEFFEVEKMITSSKKSTKSGTNQVWDNTELIPHQQEDNGYLKYFSFYSIHIFHHLLWISHKTHHVTYVVNLIFIFYVFRGIMYHNQITSNSYSGLISNCTSTLLSR